jgi:hypothetical protein
MIFLKELLLIPARTDRLRYIATFSILHDNLQLVVFRPVDIHKSDDVGVMKVAQQLGFFDYLFLFC